MDLTEDEISKTFQSCLTDMPSYDRIVDIVSDGFDRDTPNVLLYGCKGLPHTLLWDAIIRKRYGAFHRIECVGNKQWIYNETPYFFEIDLANPNQPKNIETLGEFLKEILVHVCIHASRHVFFLKNIDVICDKGSAGMFRVLLERFSNTAWFVCSTYRVAALEMPLRSRFYNVRIPLFTSSELNMLFSSMGIPFPNECTTHDMRNLSLALYISTLKKTENTLPMPLDDLCKYHAPFIVELKDKDDITIDDIRAVTQKLTVHSYSISQICSDILSMGIFTNDSDIHDFITFAAKVDHMCSLTKKYRKSLFIEWLLVAAFYST